MKKTKHDNYVIDRIGLVCIKTKTKLQGPMKTRQDNDVTDYTDVIYAKNKIELP